MARVGCPARRTFVLLMDVLALDLDTGPIASGVSIRDMTRIKNPVVSIRRSPDNDKGGTGRFNLSFPAAIKVAEAWRVGVGLFR